MEILSPIKNIGAAKVAIQNGADALYLASPSFGARTNASMDISEIKAIIDYANRYQVKTFITFNTVIFDNEINNFFEQINQVYMAGASGVILQDFALVEIIKQHFPGLEIHASTQMHVHNTDGVEFVRNMGANRVVVPREMNFERIRKIKDDTNIDIECFIHGAICVSYSGQCYDSTLLDQKSANRGRCSQYCRMPQHIVNRRTGQVVSSGQYPLNLKDMNNLENVSEYIAAGVDSLKIEGRLKNFDYVGLTTSAYRQYVDYYLNDGPKPEIVSEDLSKVYNRTFTTGRINHQNGEVLVNLNKPNNSGRLIGRVINVEVNQDQQLKFYQYVITIECDEPIIHQDNIRFLTEKFENGQVVEKIKSVNGNKISVYSKINPPQNAHVYRTQDYGLLQHFNQMINKFSRREQINLELKVENQLIYFKLFGGEYNKTDLEMEPAQKSPITKEKFLKKLLKTNDTPYDFKIIDFQYNEDLFIPMGKIGQLKQLIIEQIDQERLIKRSYQQVKLPLIDPVNEKSKTKYFVEVRTKEQYLAVKKYQEIEVLIGDVKLVDEIEIDQKDRLVLPRINYNDELVIIDEYANKYQKLAISELGTLNRYLESGKDLMTNFTLNVTNKYTLAKLHSLGVKSSLMSIELNYDKLKDLGSENSIVNIYGRVPVMIMDYCPINKNKQDTCGSCRRCHAGTYLLKDELDREFPLMYEGNARIGMYSKAPVSLLDKQDELKAIEMNKFHLRFTNETTEEVENVLSALFEQKQIEQKYIRGSFYKETL